MLAMQNNVADVLKPVVVMAKYRAMRWKIAYKHCRAFPWVDVEDVLSEVTLGFLEALRTFDPFAAGGIDSLGFYLWRAGNRHALAFCLTERFRGMRAFEKTIRGRGWPPFVSIDMPRGADEESLADTIPERQASEAPDDQDLWWQEMLAPVTPKQRQVLLLTFRDGLSQNEIAARMGMFQAGVWTMIQRGLRTLRQRRR